MKRKFTHFGLIVFLFMGLTFGAFAQGDDCANAVAVSAGNHTADGPSSGGGAANICFTGATNADWYSYTPAADGTIDIESTTTGNDTRLSFYDGTCGSLNCVDSDDDGGGGYLSLLENLTVVTGTTYYIEWDDRWEVTGFDWTLTFTPAPTCLDPTAQTETSITTTTVSLGWTENGGATTWEIEWGVTGFTQGSGTMLTGITVNPHPLTGLSTATTYDWYVRSDCGGGDYSAWTGPSTFTTACDAFTATFAENYDGVTAPAIPDCWSSIVDATTSYATVVTYTASTPNSAPNHVRLYNSDDVSAILLLITPELSDLTTQANQIRFYAKSGSTSTDMIIGTMSDPADDATFTSFSTISLTNTYTEYTIPFGPTYTATDEYIAFKHGLGGTYRYIYIDDFNYEPIPSCPAPTLQTEINFTTSGADLGWTDAAGTWDVYVVSSGSAAPGQTTPPTANNITTKPYTYSLGSANQTYDWYVRRDCDGDNIGTSSWTGPSTFTTACASVSVPWNEGFEGMASVGSGIIPNCMAEDGDWSTGDAPQSYGRDARTGTNYAYTNYSADDWLFSVGIDLTAGTSYDFSFWYVTDGNSGWTTLEAQYGTGQTSGDMTTAIGTPVSAPTNTTYVEYRGSFTPATTGTYYMGIHVVASSSPWYITFDDLLVEETPSCPAPTAQTETAITATTASLGWTEAGTATTWNIEYGTTGFTQGSGTMVTGTTTNPHSVSGLTASTTYDWYVQADCGSSTSTWTGPSTFTTACNAFTATFAENYDGVTAPAIPDCWSSIVNSTSTYSAVVTYTSSTPNSAPNHVRLYNSNDVSATLLLITPQLSDLTTQANQIRFYAKSSSNAYDLIVGTMSDPGDDATFTAFSTISLTTTYTEYTLPFGAAYTATDEYIAFKHGLGGTYRSIYIDDFNYEPMPSCPAPTTQTADAGPVSAELDWTESGSATIWDIEYGDDGFTQGAGTTVIGAAKPYDMTGLTESSDYDWYVRSDCGAGSTSTWTGPHSFATTDGTAVNPTPADGASDLLVTATTLDWDDVYGADSYLITIGTSSGNNDVASLIACAGSSYTHGSDWNSGTQYYWTVSTIYNTSTQVIGTEWDFTTECGVYTPDYTEDFTSFLPICWDENTGPVTGPTGTPGTSAWYEDGFANNGTTGSARINLFNTAHEDWLITPEFNLSAGGYELNFDVAVTAYSGTGSSNMGSDDEVQLLMTIDGGTTWTNLMTWNTGNTPSNTGDNTSVDISAQTGNPVQFAFWGSDGSVDDTEDYNFYVDNFKVRTPPTCPEPTALNHSNESINGADLAWTDASGSYWDLYIVETGNSAPTSGSTPTIDNTQDNPYTWTSGLAGTTYDWYVRTDCGQPGTNNTDVSTWTGPDSFTTLDGKATNPIPADGASGIAVTAKTFDWDDVTGATSYTINIGTATTLTDIVLDGACPASTYTYTGADWDYSEDYFWTVTTVYSGGTAASNEWDFFTECAAITTFPYTESFESGVPANCWTEEIVNDVGTDPDWTQETATLHPTGGNPVDGSNIARFNSYSCPDNSTARIVTPLLDFAGLTGMAMSFWMYHDDSYTTTPLEGVIVQISTDGATWTDVTELIERYSSAGDAWAKHTVDLSAYDGQTVHLAILGQSDYGNDSYIDMLTIHNDAPATAMWSGATDNNWSDVTNWSTTDIPYSTTDVTIPTGGLTNYPTIVAAAECDNLTIESAVGGDASILGDENLTVNGNATVQRFVTGGVWHDVSASTQGQTLQSIYFGGSPNVWLAHYNEPDNTRTFLSTLTDPMDPGAGFEIWVETGNNVVIDYTGTLQTSDLTLSTGSSTPLSWTGAEPLGYNLIGNPFASPIDLNQGTWALTDVSTSFWVWDPVAGSYQDWNTSGSTGTLTNGIVPMGQGFFIQATNTAPSITIPMASRVHSGQAFYKDGRDNEQMTFSMQAAYGEYTDGMNIAFLEGATDEFDTYDTRKMFAGEGSAPQIYTVQGEEDLGINGLPMLTEKETIVSLSYRVGENGEQTLIADLSGLLDTEVVLEDVKLDAFQSLNSNPVYVFESVTYGNPDRFLLHFTRTVTAIDTKNEDAPKVYSYDGAIYIKSSGKLAETDKVVFVYDMFGRTVLQTKVSASTLVRIPMYVSDAYFVVKTIADGKVYTSKVFVKQ